MKKLKLALRFEGKNAVFQNLPKKEKIGKPQKTLDKQN